MIKIISIFLLILVFSCSKSQEKTLKFNELHVISEVVDSLYSIEYCNLFLSPPPWSKTDSLHIQSTKDRLNSLQHILVIKDTLEPIYLSELKGLEIHDSVRVTFGMEAKDEKLFELDSLKIPDKEIITYDQFNSTGMNVNEQYGEKFLVGYLSFSRVLINKRGNLGVFRFIFSGGGDCMFEKYAIVKRTNEKWIIQKLILNWIS